MSKKGMIIQAAESAGLTVHENYGYRGGFGSTCLGVSGEYGELAMFLMNLGNNAIGFKEDSMGLGKIYYWQELK